MNYSFLRADVASAKRLGKADKHPNKNDFQRDRDRIFYSRIFRRLDKKTQVFVSGYDDNARTRLTHSLEVAQIAKRISSLFGFDLDLTEAIALGHDTGHTPFGHSGEKTLNFFMNGCEPCYGYERLFNFVGVSGFKHNLQGFKSLNELEIHRQDEKALNLTTYTLWGVVNHTTKKYKNLCEHYRDGACLKNGINCPHKGEFVLDYYDDYLSQLDDKNDWTFEGIIVSMADEIAQLHHDFEDGVCGNLIVIEELINSCENYNYFNGKLFNDIKKSKASKLCKLSTFCSIVIEELIYEYYTALKTKIIKVIKELNIKTREAFLSNKDKIYEYAVEKSNNKDFCDYFNNVSTNERFKTMKSWISDLIINSELTQTMNGKAHFIISKLFKAYLRNPQQLPDKTIVTINEYCSKLNIKNLKLENLNNYSNMGQKHGVARENLVKIIGANRDDFKRIIMRTICDYIAGMTDDYAISQYEKLYGSNNLRYV